MALKTKTITTLGEYMAVVEHLMGPGSPVWYRGAGKASHTLTPSLYRHPSKSSADDYADLESKILQRFRERSIPYQRPPMGSEEEREWEMLFVMQHFGVPTRLLDWTENPHVGLFFALTSAAFDYDSKVAHEDACVWALLPEAWNKQALADISYPGDILSVGSSQLKWYMPSGDIGLQRKIPVAMWGLHNSPRIVAQRGVFTIFGNHTDPMEKVLVDTPFDSDTLVKLIIPAASIQTLLAALSRIGITDSVIYPDLGGLAMELKRHYGYRV